MKNCEGLFLNNLGSVSIEKTLKTPKLNLDINDCGSIDFKLQTQQLITKINGIGSLEMEGNANTANIKISGIGSVNLDHLVIQESIINASGIGSLKMNVQKKLSLTQHGVANFNLKGKPQLEKFDVED